MSKAKPNRRWILYIAVPIIVILLIYVLELDTLLDAFRDLRWESVALGALFMAAGLVMISVRWRYLLDNRVGLKLTFQTDAISYMIRMFTPVYVPVLRVATISVATPLTAGQATPGIMAERLLEIVMRLVTLVVATILVASTNLASGWVLVWVFVLAGLFAGLVHFSNRAEEYLPRLTTWLARLPRLDEQRLEGPMASLGEGLSTVGTTRRLLVSLTLSLLMWFCFLASYTLLFHALDINQNWSEMAAIAAALLVVLPPSTPAMIGVFQGVTVSVLVPFQITNTSNLVAYGILLYAVMMIFWVITGLWGVKQTQLNVRELVKLRGFKKPEDMELDPDHSAEELDI